MTCIRNKNDACDLAVQDAMEVEVFSSSDEAFAAEALFQAYRSGDAEEVKRCVAQTGAFLELDNQVVRLAKRLPQGDVAHMASRWAAVL